MSSLPNDFSRKRALVRVDFNVPLDQDGNITDDKRIRGALPTIRRILDNGGSAVLMYHLGRPKGEFKPEMSLGLIVSHLSDLLDVAVKFAGDCVSEEAFAVTADLQPGEVVLLENLRFDPREKKGDAEFAALLARHGDLYINDAFGTAHRAHASTAVIAQHFEEKYAGLLMQAELDNAGQVMENAARPFTAIMGGAKVSDKIQIIQRLLDKVDNLLIGGGMAYTFLKAKGHEIGNSLVETEKVALAAALLKSARAKGVTERRIMFVHVLRNALLPVVTMAGVQVGALIGGSVIVESVFAWPGLGMLAFEALFSRDLNLLLGIFLLSAILVVAVNLVVDIVYSSLDPRIEVS